MIKIYIKYSEFKAHSVFQGKRKLLKNPECKKYVQCREKFLGKLFLKASAKLLKNLVNGKKYIQCSENFQGKLCFSGQAQVAQKS